MNKEQRIDSYDIINKESMGNGCILSREQLKKCAIIGIKEEIRFLKSLIEKNFYAEDILVNHLESTLKQRELTLKDLSK